MANLLSHSSKDAPTAERCVTRCDSGPYTNRHALHPQLRGSDCMPTVCLLHTLKLRVPIVSPLRVAMSFCNTMCLMERYAITLNRTDKTAHARFLFSSPPTIFLLSFFVCFLLLLLSSFLFSLLQCMLTVSRRGYELSFGLRGLFFHFIQNRVSVSE